LFGDLYVDLVKNFHQAFDTLGRSIADNIVDAKDWHEVWQNAIKDIAKLFLETLVGTAMKALSTKLAELITQSGGLFGALSKVAGVLGKAASGSGEVAKEGVGILKGASEGANEGSGEAGGAASAISGAIGSTLSSVLGIANLGVDVASGITQG